MPTVPPRVLSVQQLALLHVLDRYEQIHVAGYDTTRAIVVHRQSGSHAFVPHFNSAHHCDICANFREHPVHRSDGRTVFAIVPSGHIRNPYPPVTQFTEDDLYEFEYADEVLLTRLTELDRKEDQ